MMFDRAYISTIVNVLQIGPSNKDAKAAMVVEAWKQFSSNDMKPLAQATLLAEREIRAERDKNGDKNNAERAK